MVLIFPPIETAVEAIRAAAPPTVEVAVAADAEECIRLAAVAQVMVAWVPELDEVSIGVLERVRLDAPWVWVLLVTNLSPENARRVMTSPADEVVWVREVDSMRLRLAERLTGDPLEGLARAFERMENLHERARAALAAACRQVPPYLTVARWAREAGWDRRTPWKYGRRLSWTPKTILDGILLARALALRREGTTWREAAAALGINERTLRRIGRRFERMHLGDLDDLPPETFVREFAEMYLKPPSRPRSPDR